MIRSLLIARSSWLILGCLVSLLSLSCATKPETVDALGDTLRRNMRLCDAHGGMRRIDIGSEYADVWCRDSKGFRVWFYK